MIGHVGNRVGALVDGQLPLEEAERLWHHVQGCRRCSARVEREGWVKQQLAGLASAWPASAPLGLREGLADRAPLGAPQYLPPPALERADHRGALTVAVLGASSLGAAMIGVVALNLHPIDNPTDRRTAVASFQTPAPGSVTSRVRQQP